MTLNCYIFFCVGGRSAEVENVRVLQSAILQTILDYISDMLLSAERSVMTDVENPAACHDSSSKCQELTKQCCLSLRQPVHPEETTATSTRRYASIAFSSNPI